MDCKEAAPESGAIKISAVIPLYNKEATIVRAVRSILDGNKLPDEIVVVDDGSTDGSVKALWELGSPMVRVIRQENKGAAAARNTGIRAAAGEWIAFLDADDIWLPRFLEAASELAGDFPGAGICGAAYAVCRGEEIIPAQREGVPPHPWKGFLDNLFVLFKTCIPFNSSSVLVRREALDEAGLFMEGEAIGEDVQMWLNISLRHPIAFTTEICSHYRTDAPNRAYVETRALHAAGYSRWLDETAKNASPEMRKAVLSLRESVELGRLSSLAGAGEGRRALAVYRGFPFGEYRSRARLWVLLAFLPRFLYRALRRVRAGFSGVS